MTKTRKHLGSLLTSGFTLALALSTLTCARMPGITQSSTQGPAAASASPLYLPVGNTLVTSQFGTRVHPITGTRDFHSGVDLSAHFDQPIYSILDGVVVQAGPRGYLGNSVELRHAKSGVTSIYGHMEKLLVHQGQTVKQGDTLGLAGSTGRSTGPHLHLTIKSTRTNKYIEPLAFLKGQNISLPQGAEESLIAMHAEPTTAGSGSVLRSRKRNSQGASAQAAVRNRAVAQEVARNRAVAQGVARQQRAQQIATLRNSIAKANNEIATEQAAVTVAMAKVESSTADAKKFAYLYEQGAISRKDAETKQAIATQAQTRVAELKHKLSVAKNKLHQQNSLLAMKDSKSTGS